MESKAVAAKVALAGLTAAGATPMTGLMDSLANEHQIPAPAVAIYLQVARTAPCPMDYRHLAGIGWIESGHGTYGGSSIAANGDVRMPDGSKILGVPLDGSTLTRWDGVRVNLAYIPDTDGAAWDDDDEWDRAAGPMQFIPTTWAVLKRDGNGDGVEDPHNYADAVAAAAAHLCEDGYTTDAPWTAIRAYNGDDSSSSNYADDVIGYAAGLPVDPGFELPKGQFIAASGAAAAVAKATSGECRSLIGEDPGTIAGAAWQGACRWLTHRAKVLVSKARRRSDVEMETAKALDKAAAALDWVAPSESAETPPDVAPPAQGRIVDVEGIEVDESAAESLRAMLKAARVEGVQLRGSGFRSPEEQIALRKQNCADWERTPAMECNPPTALPGRSPHEVGLAVDFQSDGWSWLEGNAHRFGWAATVPGEPWHYERRP